MEKQIMIPRPWECDLQQDSSLALNDGLLYVPYDESLCRTFAFPGWHHPQCFGNEKPVEIEYCSGNGSWIISRAHANAHKNFVAVERKGARMQKIWKKGKRQALNNLLVVYGEAHSATHHHFPTDSVSAIYINFPDPWPKRRHAKNRLIQPAFLDEMHRILKSEGTVTVVTDDPEYSKHLIAEFQNHKGFRPAYPAPYYRTDIADYGTSYFEELWRYKGKDIRYHLFEVVKSIS